MNLNLLLISIAITFLFVGRSSNGLPKEKGEYLKYHYTYYQIVNNQALPLFSWTNNVWYIDSFGGTKRTEGAGSAP